MRTLLVPALALLSFGCAPPSPLAGPDPITYTLQIEWARVGPSGNTTVVIESGTSASDPLVDITAGDMVYVRSQRLDTNVTVTRETVWSVPNSAAVRVEAIEDTDPRHTGSAQPWLPLTGLAAGTSSVNARYDGKIALIAVRVSP